MNNLPRAWISNSISIVHNCSTRASKKSNLQNCSSRNLVRGL